MDLAANERLQQGGARALEPDWSDPPERGEEDGGGTLSWRRSDGQLSAMGKVKVIPPQQNIQSPSRLVVYFIMLLRTKTAELDCSADSDHPVAPKETE